MLRLGWLFVLLLSGGAAVAAGSGLRDLVTSGTSADPGSARAGARSPQADRASVEALERDWLAHVSDGAALKRILADDFIHVVPPGLFLTKQQHISWAVQHPAPKNRSAQFEVLRVRIYGDTAIANGIVVNSDPSGGDIRRTIFTDVFAFRDGAWQAVNAQENPITPGS